MTETPIEATEAPEVQQKLKKIRSEKQQAALARARQRAYEVRAENARVRWAPVVPDVPVPAPVAPVVPVVPAPPPPVKTPVEPPPPPLVPIEPVQAPAQPVIPPKKFKYDSRSGNYMLA